MRSILTVIESESIGTTLTLALKKEYSLLVYSDTDSGAQLLDQSYDALIVDLYLPRCTEL